MRHFKWFVVGTFCFLIALRHLHIICGTVYWREGWLRKVSSFNVTMVSPDKDKDETNIHYIHLEATYETLYHGENSLDLLEISDQTATTAIFGIYQFCELCCDGFLNSKGLDAIINYPSDFKFDVVIHDFTCGPCLLPLLHKFKYPPLVSVTAFSNPPYSFHLTGGHKYPAYVPHFVTRFPQLMNFQQRLMNTFLYTVDAVLV